MHKGFWSGNPKERDHLDDLGIDERITVKQIFNEWGGRACTGLICLKTVTGGGLL